MIEKVCQMIEDFLNGRYDALRFSYDLPDFIYDNFEKIQEESTEMATLLNDCFPCTCDEYERDAPVGPFQEKIRKEYKKVLELLRQ